ncbi:MAG: hypothetical protein ABIH37_05915 [archaeon]
MRQIEPLALKAEEEVDEEVRERLKSTTKKVPRRTGLERFETRYGPNYELRRDNGWYLNKK